MVMTISSSTGTRKLEKGSPSQQGRIFDQDGSAMDPIDVEPLRSTSMALMPYGTSEENVPTADTTRQQSPSPIEESPSV